MRVVDGEQTLLVVQEEGNYDAKFEAWRQKVLPLDINSRLLISNLPKQRAEYIVVAVQLLHFILRETKIKVMKVSSYAMKEGILAEMIHGKA